MPIAIHPGWLTIRFGVAHPDGVCPDAPEPTVAWD
jgi:hypothetical protein